MGTLSFPGKSAQDSSFMSRVRTRAMAARKFSLEDMLSELGEDALQSALYPQVTLRSARSLACCNRVLAHSFKQYINSPLFAVSVEDATWDNAKFVASLGLEALRVEGETCVPVLP